jgi:hypothetical protein
MNQKQLQSGNGIFPHSSCISNMFNFSNLLICLEIPWVYVDKSFSVAPIYLLLIRVVKSFGKIAKENTFS